jgi:CDP-4-dehydro-6-deoxyglucose reductase, E3
MPLVVLPTGESFEASIGVSILDAASRAHIFLPYSCKTGRCSTCKCRVVSGTTRVLHPEIGLKEEDWVGGWILSCVRSVETDVVLDVDNLGAGELPVPKMLPCRIGEIKRPVPDVVQVFLRLPPKAEFHFIPGQYVNVIGAGGIQRSYSIANTNFDEGVLELHIRAVAGGAMSDYWFGHARQNDLLRLNGPLGTFFLRKTAGLDLVFLATGTGIAPVKAMLGAIAYLPHEEQPRTVTVLWGGRRSEDFYLNMADIPLTFTFIPVQSRPCEGWDGARGYVQDALLNLGLNFRNTTVYACGSDAMIHGAKARLLKAGLPAKNFYSDAFVSSGTNL